MIHTDYIECSDWKHCILGHIYRLGDAKSMALAKPNKLGRNTDVTPEDYSMTPEIAG